MTTEKIKKIKKIKKKKTEPAAGSSTRRNSGVAVPQHAERMSSLCTKVVAVAPPSRPPPATRNPVGAVAAAVVARGGGISGAASMCNCV